MSINTAQYSRLVTGKIIFKLSGLTEWKNLGDLEVVVHDPKVDRVDVIGSGKGSTSIRTKLPSRITQMYSATATEKTPELVELSLLASPAINTSQTLATAQAASFTANLRSALLLNAINVTSVVVKNSTNTVTYVAGTDYDLDAGNGIIEVIKGGGITIGATINVTFDRPAITRKAYTPNTKRIFEGDVKIHIQDGFSDDPVEVHTFYGQLFISQNSSQGSGEIQKWGLEFYPLRSHSVTLRDMES